MLFRVVMLLCVLLGSFAFPSLAQITTVSFTCIGATQNFVVPPCVTEITVKCWGAGGGGAGTDSYSGGVGGGGSFSTAIIPTIPGETITVSVGCKGLAGAGCSGGAPGGAGGWGFGVAGAGGNAGPSGCSGGGAGGGGSSAVTRAGTLLIGAGGGGGGGGGGCTSLGGYGGFGATNGSNTTCTTGGVTAGNGNPNGTNGGTMGQDGGGGGGGGGGATMGGIGGNAPPPGPSCNTANDCGAGGAGAGDSWVPVGGTITFAVNQAGGNNTDPDLCAGCAGGGNAQSMGGDGMVVFSFVSSPTADFYAASVCFGNTVAFSDSSCNTVVSWNWNFGDAQTSTVQHPTHNYASPNAYSVTLIVTDGLGDTDTNVQIVDIHQNPVASFTAPTVCAYDSSLFFDNTIYPGTVTWAWDFGDSQISTQQNPSNTYASYGTYQVTLTVTSDSGCVDDSVVTYYVHPVPVANFTVADVCKYDSADFVDGTSLANGTWTNSWDFGDGQTSILKQPKHLYATAGTYTVTLITTSDSLCTDTTQQTITIFPVPVAQFLTNNVCQDVVANFGDLSSGMVSWDWDFADGATSTLASPTHVFTNDSTYPVRLIVTSVDGCVDTIIKSIRIHPLPIPSFTVLDTCVYNSAVFVNTSTIANGDVVAWAWDFGDGTFSSAKGPSHLYGSYGTYTVTQIETSDSMCVGTYVGSVTIHPQPSMAFAPSSPEGCSELCVEFFDQSDVVTGVPVVEWLWDFGDGTSSTEKNPPSHCYPNGTASIMYFTVELIATSSDGCLDTLDNNAGVEIWPLPIADFSVDPQPATILFPYITFTNLSSGAVGDPTTYIWDWGNDSATWTGFDTLNVYDNQDSGTYIVELKVSNQYNCKDDTTQVVKIDLDYTMFAPTAFTPDYDGINDYFMVKGIGLENLLEFEFSIYNRWGDRIFFFDTPNDPGFRGWDGWANGGRNQAQGDVYVWEIKTRNKLTDGHSRHHYTGHVTLLR
ncbi:MAG: PKD domain-containing protein [Flavobacteriales bacterium]|nr:PKD domain-containing protein [Flavobacteriales bacterium]